MPGCFVPNDGNDVDEERGGLNGGSPPDDGFDDFVPLAEDSGAASFWAGVERLKLNPLPGPAAAPEDPKPVNDGNVGLLAPPDDAEGNENVLLPVVVGGLNVNEPVGIGGSLIGSSVGKLVEAYAT